MEETINIDWIKTVKEQWNNNIDKVIEFYIVNGTMTIPNNSGIGIYTELQEWLKTNVAEVPYTDAELEAKRLADELADAKLEAKKAIAIITVTTASGITLYADPESRTDLSDAISIMVDNGIEEYVWKTVDGVKTVSLADMKEARQLGLLEKGKLVGAVA